MKPAHCRLLLALLILPALPARAGQADRHLDIYWCDVEGGGATLIVTPTGESILIDSGNPGPRDAGRIHHVAADVAGLRKIDFYITTHFHIDHFGGASQLAALMPIGQVYDRGIPEHDPDHRANADGLWLQSIRPYRDFPADGRNLVTAGIFIPLRQPGAVPLSLRCVASGGHMVDPPLGAAPNPLSGEDTHHDLPSTDNDLSSAWILEYGPFRFWDGGDLTWNMEGMMVTPVNRVGQVDVYQVDHHGLEFSNNPVLIHSLAPTVSVMNNGPKKGTAHGTIKALESSPGIQGMFQLHKNLRPEDPQDNTSDEFIANFAGDPNHADANYIKLSVDPLAVFYTVSIPASGFSRTYQTRLEKPSIAPSPQG
jgi:beta-lactamase superfamily II metal-dependent hydrolase